MFKLLIYYWKEGRYNEVYHLSKDNKYIWSPIYTYIFTSLYYSNFNLDLSVLLFCIIQDYEDIVFRDEFMKNIINHRDLLLRYCKNDRIRKYILSLS